MTQSRITTFKTSLSHCICHRVAGKALAARPIVPTGQASWFCLLPESNRMRSLHNREDKKGLTSKADSLTGKLEGQSYNCSSALTPVVELIFLNIGMSYNSRQLTISVTPSLAWQIDIRLARPSSSRRGSWRQGRKPSMSEVVAAVATCGDCSSAAELGGCTEPPTADHSDFCCVQQLQLLRGRFTFDTSAVHGAGVEHGQPMTVTPSTGTRETCQLYKWHKKHKLTISWLQQTSQLLSLREGRKRRAMAQSCCSCSFPSPCPERAAVTGRPSAWELSYLADSTTSSEVCATCTFGHSLRINIMKIVAHKRL